MNLDNPQGLYKKINCLLDLDRQICGMRFLHSKEEYDNYDAIELKGKLPYCVVVKSASNGHSIKLNLEHTGCSGAARALGFTPRTEKFNSGIHYLEMGLYKDLNISHKVLENYSCMPANIYGVVVKPLDKFEENPDIVILVTTTYNVMRVLQGYTYSYGTCKTFKMIGLQAFCSECTAYPYLNDDINVSMLCSGTRYVAGWGRSELAVGIPYNKFPDTVLGIAKTVNPLERDPDKKRISNALKDNLLDDYLDIEFGKNYDDGAYSK